ncbi:MAG: hypothetical protein PHU81_04460 [Acidobacteriota bacterium]|nr:hypothetical protein [Acidobacteriota bacterium]
MAKSQQSNIIELIKSLKAFANTFSTINVDMFLDETDYSSTEYALGRIEINAVDNELVQNKKTGNFEIMIEPYSPVRFTFMPNLVYSFARAENGKHIGWITPLVFGIIPRKFDNPVLGAKIKLGILPESGQLGFFLRPGIIIYKKISLRGGLSYQQIGEDKYKLGFFINLTYELK